MKADVSHFFIAVGLAFAAPCFGQSASQIDQLKSALDGKGNVEFQRLTSEGKFSGCELSYRVLFRDYRAHKGELVAAFGSINSYFFEGKTFNVAFKLRTALIDPVTGQLRPFQPAYAGLAIGQSLEPFKGTEFRCEGDGICKSYYDNPKFELLALTTEHWLPAGPSITLTTAKGGTDKTVVLRDTPSVEPTDYKKSVDAFADFNGCLGEVMNSLINYLKEAERRKAAK